MLKCEIMECNDRDCPCVRLSRWMESDWIERNSKVVRNVGDLWAFQQGLKEIARREIERLGRVDRTAKQK